MFQHDSAIGEAKNTFALGLVDYGYEVWFGNNRGMRYSNKHDRDGEWSLRERWDFNLATMGEYDLAAMIEKVAEVSQKKVTVVGFSSGGA